MQVIYKNEVEGGVGRRTSIVDIIICAERDSGCAEGKHNGGIRVRRSKI